MVPLTALWLPILLSAFIAFVASSIIHMVLPYHRTDFKRLPAEGEVMAALREFDIPPGDYLMPCAGGPKDMNNPDFLNKMKEGPVAVMTVIPSGPPTMGRNLALWFIYCLVVAIFSAYITGRAPAPGAPYRAVFRFAGATAFIAYAAALWQNSIWYRRAWSTTVKATIDGLIYALLTAGVFGWLWPR